MHGFRSVAELLRAGLRASNCYSSSHWLHGERYVHLVKMIANELPGAPWSLSSLAGSAPLSVPTAKGRCATRT